MRSPITLIILLLAVLSYIRTQVLGIDFGTEFWKAALISPGKNLVIVENSRSERKTLNSVLDVLLGIDCFPGWDTILRIVVQSKTAKKALTLLLLSEQAYKIPRLRHPSFRPHPLARHLHLSKSHRLKIERAIDDPRTGCRDDPEKY